MSPRARSSAGESAPGEGPERAPGWAKLVVEDDFSWSEAVGGARGLVESILPGLVFVVVFVLTRDLVLTSALAAGAALIALGLRLLARQPLTQAISGVGHGTRGGPPWCQVIASAICSSSPQRRASSAPA